MSHTDVWRGSDPAFVEQLIAVLALQPWGINPQLATAFVLSSPTATAHIFGFEYGDTEYQLLPTPAGITLRRRLGDLVTNTPLAPYGSARVREICVAFWDRLHIAGPADPDTIH